MADHNSGSGTVVGNPFGDQSYREGRGATGRSGHGLDRFPDSGWATHAAKDMGAPMGTPVYAAFDGTVTGSRLDERQAHTGKVYGDQVWVTSGDGRLQAFYTHIDRAEGIEKGTEVKRGDVIGYVTHWDDSPKSSHLHFGLASNQGGQWRGIDPEPMLAATKRSSDGHELIDNYDGSYSIGDQTFPGQPGVAPRSPLFPPESPADPNFTRPDGLPGQAPGSHIPIATPADANSSGYPGYPEYVPPPPEPRDRQPYTPADPNYTRPDGLPGRAEGPPAPPAAPPPPTESRGDANYNDPEEGQVYVPPPPAPQPAPDPQPYSPAGPNYTRRDGLPGKADPPPPPLPPRADTPADANYTDPSGSPDVAPGTRPPVSSPPAPGPMSANYTDETGRAVRGDDVPAKPDYDSSAPDRASGQPGGPDDRPVSVLSDGRPAYDSGSPTPQSGTDGSPAPSPGGGGDAGQVATPDGGLSRAAQPAIGTPAASGYVPSSRDPEPGVHGGRSPTNGGVPAERDPATGPTAADAGVPPSADDGGQPDGGTSPPASPEDGTGSPTQPAPEPGGAPTEAPDYGYDIAEV